jgi:hypothetical protein
MTKLRIALARWLLGKHCPCYNMGYHKLCDFTQHHRIGKQK